MSDNWKGIFATPQSAYHEDGRFDYDGLDTQLGFCVASGAHGIVWPVMASQFSLLSRDERKKTTEQVVKKIDGRIPVVIGVATVWTEASVDLAQHAETNGAMVDILAEIFNRFDSGDEAGARELHNLMAPYHIIHDLYGMGLTFEMLKRRGIIQNAIPRYGNFRPLDDHDERELSIILEALGPFFKTSPPI